MNRRRLLMAASQQSGGGGGNLNFPIVITTDYCEDGGAGLEVCYKNLADDGAFYDALFQFLKANDEQQEDDTYMYYESSEPILVIDNIGFSYIEWIEGDEYISSEAYVPGGYQNFFIHNNGMIEVEKWG